MVGEGRKSVNGIDKPTRVKRQSLADRFLIASINVFHLRHFISEPAKSDTALTLSFITATHCCTAATRQKSNNQLGTKNMKQLTLLQLW